MNRTQAQALRVTVYVMLVVSAGAVFWLGDRLWAAATMGDLPRWAALLPVCAFTAFVVAYTADRLLLAKFRNYPAGRAFFQVIFALLFVGLLWPIQIDRARRSDRDKPERALGLLWHSNPEVRALACEVLGLRADNKAVEAVAAVARNDKVDRVRQTCTEALTRLNPHEMSPVAEEAAKP